MSAAEPLPLGGRPPRVRHGGDWPLLVVGAAMLALIARRAALSGSWLDEYWQIWISSAPDLPALAARLVADAHPPWFNLLARPILALAGGSLPVSRLVSLGLALGLMAWGLRRLAAGQPPAERSFYSMAALFVVGTAGPATLLGLADSLRSYPWLIVLATLQGAILVTVARGALVRRDRPFAALITLAAVSIHHIHAVAAVAVALATILCAWQRRDRPAARVVAIGLGAGIVVELATGLLQLPHWRAHMDHNWIASSAAPGLPIPIELVLAWAGANLLAVGCILLAGIRRQLDRATWWLLGAGALALLIWLALNLAVPMLVPRYLVAIPVLLSLAGALAASKIATTGMTRALGAMLLLLVLALDDLRRPWTVGWEGEARVIAEAQARCPTTRVVATSPWNMGAAAASHAAAFEGPVTHFAYRRIGARFGFVPRIVGPAAPVTIAPADCPVILWVEHVSDLARLSPSEILRAAGVGVAGSARLRFQRGENGGLVWIERPNSSNVGEAAAKAQQ